jgi:uncharacterized protein (DUF4415 family)
MMIVSSWSIRSVMTPYGSSLHGKVVSMTEKNIKNISLEELKALRAKGDLKNPSGSQTEITLPDEFWENAKLVEPKARRSVHLKLEPEVFDAFYEISNGKGHLSLMQNVLKAYANTQKKKAS